MRKVMPDTADPLPQPTTRDLLRPWRAPSPPSSRAPYAAHGRSVPKLRQ